MMGIFPVNRRILGYWNWIWFGLFIVAATILAVAFKSGGALEKVTDYTLDKPKGRVNVGMCFSFLVLISILLWDIFLFVRKAGRPLRRLWKSLIPDEKTGALTKARYGVRQILFLDFLMVLSVLWLALLFLMKKEEKFFGSKVKDAIKNFIKYEGNESNWIMYTGIAIIVFGLISFLCRLLFAKNWSYCLFSCPNRNMGSLVCSKPGSSRLLHIQCAFWIFAIAGFICFLILSQLDSQKKNWLKWMKAETEELSWTKPMYQGILAGLLLLLVLALVSFFSHSVKNRRDLDYALNRGNLCSGDMRNLMRAKKIVNFMDNFHVLLGLCWFLSAACIIFLNKDFESKLADRKKFVVYSAAITAGLTSLSAIPILMYQIELKSVFNKCNQIDVARNQRLLRLTSANF